MRFNQLIILFLLFNFQVNAQQTFIGNENGQWVILSKSEKVKLPLEYHSVSNFDLAGFASFGVQDKFGVINSIGNVVCAPEYIAIEQLGGGFYSCITESDRILLQMDGELQQQMGYNELNQLETTWLEVIDDSTDILINTVSKERISIDFNSYIGDHLFGYMQIRLDTNWVIFDKSGVRLEVGNGIVDFYPDYVRIQIEDGNKIVYSDHVIDLPQNLTYLKVSKEEIQCSTSKTTTILDPTDGRVILTVSCDDLRRISSRVFVFKKGWKSGLVRVDGTVICPAIYFNILQLGEYYQVSGANGVGVMSASGEIIVPCKFSRIRQRGGFFEVTTSIGMKGIYSTITKKPILAENYARVAISTDKIRAWIKDNLILIEFDSVHKITSRLNLKNTISKYELAYSKKTKSVDQRLYSVGWFDEAKPIYSKEGFQTGESTRWGIRDNNDSLLSKAKYSLPNFIPLAGFSTIYGGKVKFSHLGGAFDMVPIYTVIDLTTGGPLMQEGIISIDSTDLLTRSFSRFLSPKGFGYITGDNKAKYVMHMDGGDTEFVRYCISKTKGRIGAEENEEEGVHMRRANLNGDIDKYSPYINRIKTYPKVIFPEAQWNFLDTNGINLFDQSFDFTHAFHRKTAIFKNEGRWGVLNSDTVIIPNIYKGITRLSEVSDTIFKVRIVPGGMRFLDTLSKDLKLPISKFIKSKSNYGIIQQGRQKLVLNDTYEILSNDGKSYKVLDDESYYSKLKKEFHVNSRTGDFLGIIKIEPIAVFFDSYVLVLSKGRYGVINFNGDTLIDFNYKRIEQNGEYIFAYNGSHNLVYNHDLEILRDAKTSNVLFDLVNNQFAIVKGDKAKVYDETNELLVKCSNINPSLFLNGMLIQTGSYGFSIDVTEEDREMPPKIFDLQQLDDYGYLIWINADTCYYYAPDWKKYSDFEGIKRVKYLGEGFVSCRTDEGLMIYREDGSKILDKKESIKGKFENGFLLMTRGLEHYYLNTELEHAFSRTYRKATSFVGGYAAVKEQKGWTIIDSRGYPKSVSNFEEIIPRGQNIFETKKQALYGLFDSHGTEIIPVEFEQINVLYGTIIQGIKKTEIFYFDLIGNPIDLNRN